MEGKIGTRYEDFKKICDKNMERLHEIWTEFGLAQDVIDKNEVSFYTHLSRLSNQMTEDQEQQWKEVTEEVEKLKKKLDMLCVELEIPKYQPDTQHKLLASKEDLTEKYTYLQEIKKKKVKEMEELLKEDEYLCEQLSLSPFYAPKNTTPTTTILSELQKHIDGLKSEKEKRDSIFVHSKARILDIMNRLEISPHTQFECEVISESNESFVPSNINMQLLSSFLDRMEKRLAENKTQSRKLLKTLEELWLELKVPTSHKESFLSQYGGVRQDSIVAMQEEVNRCRTLTLENMQRLCGSLRQQITDICAKCYITPHQLNLPNADTPEQMEELKEELDRMREYFKERRVLIDMVKHYDDVWKALLEFEEEAKRPERLFQKSWSTLKEEKERNKLSKELHKLAGEIEDHIGEWEKEKGEEFSVMGRSFKEWVQDKWDDIRDQKENEKKLRQEAKKRQVREEMLHGTKPTTTPNKRLLAQNSTSSSKSRRVLHPTFTNSPTKSPCIKQPVDIKIQPQPTATPFLLSDTIVASHEIQGQLEETIALSEPYEEFQYLLNEQQRHKTRSSIMPHQQDNTRHD